MKRPVWVVNDVTRRFGSQLGARARACGRDSCRDDGFAKLFVPQSQQWIDLQDVSGGHIAGNNRES